MTAAAHVIHGEAERLVEKRALDLDTVLIENRRAVRVLQSKLLVQTLEASKAQKARWNKGLLLWRKQRHRYSMMLVMRRIRSDEFRQPQSIVEALGQVRQQQQKTFEERRLLVRELFFLRQRTITTVQVRALEEQNTLLNDRAQEAFDELLSDIKDLREALEVSAERMLGELALELEIHDARQEWKGHDTVASLIDADVRPPLQECLDFVRDLLLTASEQLTRQDEAQHYANCRLLSFYLILAKKREVMSKRVDEFEVNYNGEVEDCDKDFEDTCERYEQTMVDYHNAINDAAHHDTLGELKHKTFDHLDSMAVGYRKYTDTLLWIHGRYPGESQALIRRETRNFCASLGLAMDPTEEAEAWAEERRAAAEAAEAEAIAAAGGAEPPEGEEEDEAAAAARKEAVEAAIAKVREEAEAKEAEALEAEAAAAEGLADLEEWPKADSTACRVLARLGLADFREEVMGGPPGVLPPPETEPGEEANAEAAAEGGADAEVEPEEKAEEEPARLYDGTLALVALQFDTSWLEENLEKVREDVFGNVGVNKKYLDRVDIPAACEECRRDLDQRLRRHTNRKGEVQVEWYVPRFATIAKHKDKFERHLVEIARKCQEQDDVVDSIFQEVEEAEEQFRQRLLDLQGRLGEAETLPVLTAFERQANDFAAGFKNTCKGAVQRLMELSTRAPQALQKENRAFLTMCRSGDEQYSESEIQFYSGEMDELNASLEQRAQERSQRARDLEGQIDQKQKEPLDEFAVAYAEAVELLCQSKGYGRKYGQPRRNAQERVRTLIARAATVKQNIETLMDYVQQLCQVDVPADVGIELTSLPRPPSIVRLIDYFRRGDESWTFSGELLGVLYVLVCTMSVIGSHLDAFKPEQATRYLLESMPQLRVLREDETSMPAAETQEEVFKRAAEIAESEEQPREPEDLRALADATSLKAETSLRGECLMRALGPVLQAEHFPAEIQSIVKSANEAYAGQPGGTPDFMQKFLSDMQLSSEHARQEASRGLRSWGNELREQTLMNLADVMYGELTTRTISELMRSTKETQQSSVRWWNHNDKLRADHEQRLNPGLSNPNAEAQLLALMESEANRHQEALDACTKDRETMANALRGAAESFVRRLSSVSEAAVRIVDSLPLHGHFAALPGDEQIEPPRMSIKRRLRRLNAAESAAEAAPPTPAAAKGKGAPPPEPASTTPILAADGGDGSGGLPARTWPGLPRYELRGSVLGNGWPEDPELIIPPAADAEADAPSELDTEKLKQTTEALVSFRSPVHRKLIEQRDFFYQKYKAQFLAELEKRAGELSTREQNEAAGERNWQAMVRQLRGEV
eukprot:TRINITY_DN6524_c0_g1_i11.p1 TRINITY_DN6524_c0_g1~~TRINITY_DN6524_c0_g1_i11.p1  ORF type:complete len:1339 (+),score=386.61 TRINITY_DN6524_c0_g1_i11:47-4018(+)